MVTSEAQQVDALIGELALSAGRSPDAYLNAAHATLVRLMRHPGLLDGVSLDRRPGDFTRNLLFGTGGISIWAMVWAPGSATPVHDHHCSCCFGLLIGTLRETHYRAISETHAVTTANLLLRPGHVACMLPSGPNLHGMANDGPEEAISIHVYGYDHRAQASSVDRTYAVAAA